MAKVTSGSFSTNKYETRNLLLSWSRSSYSVDTNETTISWTLKGGGSDDGYWYYSAPFEVIINGENVYSSSTRIKLYYGTIVASGTLKIKHNTDGSKSFSASVRGAIFSGSYNVSGSGSWDLVDIPRASSVSGGSGNIGSATTISISRASSSFTHVLYYSFGNISKKVIAYAVATSYEWTIPTELYAQIPNSKSGTGAITCETYNGSTLVGTSTCSFTASVTNSNPTTGTFTYKDNNSTTTAITENNQRIIRSNSNLLFTLGSATAKNSSTISKYEVTFNGVTKSRTSAGDLDFGKINLSSNATATLKVTDSRGFTASKDITIIVDDWVLPTALITLNRKNNFYSESYLKVDGSYSSLNSKNTMTIQYQYKKVSEANYSTLTTISDNVQTTLELDNNYQWNIKVLVKDKIGTTTYNLVLDRGIPIIYFDRLNSNVGINCFPDGNYKLDIDGNTNGTNLPVATGYNSLDNFNRVNAGEYLYKSGMYSANVDNAWYNLLNVRHRNGNNDGNLYGFQIRNKFTMGSPLEYRQQNNGTWGEWKTINSVAFAKMHTWGYFDVVGDYITSWTDADSHSRGGFECNIQNGWILIPKGTAKFIRAYAHIAGYGNYSGYLEVFKSGATSNYRSQGFLHQNAGNGYGRQNICETIFELDDTYDNYVKLWLNGYNGAFSLNNGFGQNSSFIVVEKIM